MKGVAKCYIYFGSVLAFLLLLLLNFLLTRDRDGFMRLKSQYGIKLQPLFCFQAAVRAKACGDDPRVARD